MLIQLFGIFLVFQISSIKALFDSSSFRFSIFFKKKNKSEAGMLFGNLVVIFSSLKTLSQFLKIIETKKI